MWPEPDLAGFRNSHLAGSGFGTTRFSDHRTTSLVKLMVSTMLSAAIKRQYSSVTSLFAAFDVICGTQ